MLLDVIFEEEETEIPVDFGETMYLKGPKGDKGDKGDTGPKGENGADGRSFVIQDIFPTLAALRAAYPQGNEYAYQVTGENGEIFIWSELVNDWSSLGALKGPKGDKGDKGDTGDTGPKGDKGDTGETGPKGDKGDTGETGPKGDKGDTGETGPKGDKGDKGDTGSGVPAGGTTGQVLAKASGTDYDTEWSGAYRTASAQDMIDAAQNADIAARAKADEIGIVITGARPAVAVTAGQYVIVRGSTISNITDGLYTAVNALSPSTDVTAADLSSVNGGGLNDVSKPITSVSVYYPTYRTGAEAVNADDGVRVVVYSDGSKELKGLMVVTSELPNDNVEMLTFSTDVSLKANNNGNMQGWGFMAKSTGDMTIPIRFNANKVYSWGTAVPIGIWLFSFRYC